MNKEKLFKNFRITVISLPDREDLVAEIFYKNEQWAEISQETGELLVQFYNSDNQNYWEFSLSEAIQVLESARFHLIY